MKQFSKEELRRQLLAYHFLWGERELSQKEGVKEVFSRLGSIQYDPLDVAGRNADLSLQARVSGYTPALLFSLLYEERFLLDGYDKEMCIYPAADYPFFAPVRAARADRLAAVLEKRGQSGALSLLEEVLAFVEENGPTGTKDLSIGCAPKAGWGHRKLSSAALNFLYSRGDLSVAKKRGTQKYYDLTCRLYKAPAAQPLPPALFLQRYLYRRLCGVGAATAKNSGAFLGHFLSEKEPRQKALLALCEQGEIEPFAVDGVEELFYAPPAFFKAPSPPFHEKATARFLAPLDNLLWNRDALRKIFDFDYSWEVYLPAEKRKYGYYVLPVLYEERFIARFEPETTRPGGLFTIRRWWWEEGVQKTPEMQCDLESALRLFAAFLGAENNPANSAFLFS